MIRFSAFLVVVAVGLLVAGVVTSRLLLVYIAIGVSGAALLALGAGAVFKRSELFGKSKTAESGLGQPEPVDAHVPAVRPEPQVLPLPATVAAGSGWPAAAQPGPSRAGYLPAEQPPRTQPPAWGSAIPPAARPVAPAVGTAVEQAQTGPPGGRTADVQRPPAAFTPRTADYQRVGEGQRPADYQRAGEGQRSAGDQQAIKDHPSAGGERAAKDQLPRKDQLSTESEPARTPWLTGTQAPTEDQRASQDRPATEHVQTARQAAKDQPTANYQPTGEDQPTAEDQPTGEDQRASEDRRAMGREQPAGQAHSEQPAVSAGNGGGPAPAASAAAPAALPTVSQMFSPAAGPPPDLQREVTVVPGVPRYHKARCILIRFMGEGDLEKMTLSAARKAGCTPCRACLPDQPERVPS